MKVCACQNVTLDDIVEAMQTVGNDAEAIRKYTDAGRGCSECLQTPCDDVDLPFPDALLNAQALLEQRQNR
ncbi:MAG: (2Fe-2S)-binding protein [Sulfuricurvum sp.]|jgi:bacterioferritin-associated ferredoxin|uniref:(2Fe-2S)-binding protein n=1 Tax=Sulfuricurvum sp. TaxID=2025608 RepID=UPI0025D43212|nr:(2Fe-2S)-binding protein [Sulfuricurvum sp.]MCK9373583.1 (2Fe-2S)-binding protein [Sulfuricurvum sp.]